MSNIVTVSGLPGSGTSTLCAMLAKETGMPYVYAGQIFREQAKKRGMSLAEFGALCEKDDRVDRALDDEQTRLLQDAAHNKSGLILEGRLAGWLAKQAKVRAFKVWVDCDDDERIRRIVQRDGGDAGEQKQITLARERSETDRYKRYYGISLHDVSPYDLVLDSTQLSAEEMLEPVLAALRSD